MLFFALSVALSEPKIDSCRQCIINHNYIRWLLDRNVSSIKISEELQMICGAFGEPQNTYCIRDANNQFDHFDIVQNDAYTSQEICYRLGKCRKPGPKMSQMPCRCAPKDGENMGFFKYVYSYFTQPPNRYNRYAADYRLDDEM